MAAFSPLAMAEDVITIGDVNSYTNYPDHLTHYKNGMDLALDEINAAGGVDGKKLVVVTRDDKGTAGDAIRAAEELVAREQVNALSGSFLSSVALALNDFAGHNETMFLASMSMSDRMIWQESNPYGFRLRAGTYTQSAILAEKAAELGKKRWALVYPNYEFGQRGGRQLQADAAGGPAGRRVRGGVRDAAGQDRGGRGGPVADGRQAGRDLQRAVRGRPV